MLWSRVVELSRRFGLAGLLAASSAWGAPNEIKVFTDELAAYGEHTLEVHANKAGGAAPLRLMPEYSYGLRPDWELSFQLPSAFSGDASRVEGYRAELQYVAPHDPERGFYWGLNVELARNERLNEARFWNLELVPIVGYRAGRWHAAANPGIEKPLSGAAGSPVFQPAAKIAYNAFARNHYGIEYYVDAGPLRHRSPREEQSRVVYFAWDGKIGRSDINLAIGRGVTDASDRWVAKAIYEVSF